MQTRLPRLLAVAVLTVLALTPMAQAAQLGAYGTIATTGTVGLSGSFSGTFAAAQIVYQDTGSTAGALETAELVFLDLNGDGDVDTNEIQISTGGTGAGASVVTPIAAGSIATSTNPGPTALNGLLRFKDTLPIYSEGGPDGLLNPGEILFVDVDQNTLLSAGDLLLSGGSPGSRQASADTDDVWNIGTECIYQGTGTLVAVGMRRISACGAFAAGSSVAPGDADVTSPASLTSVSGIAITTPAPRSVTDGGTTATSTTVTSLTAAFTAADVGSSISGGSLPAGAWITTINSGTSVEVSAAASTTATAQSITITPVGARTVAGGSTTLGSTTVTTAAAAFSAADVGRTISGTGISGTITVVTGATTVTVSQAATATGAGVVLTLGANTGAFLSGQSAYFGSTPVTNGHYRITPTPDTVVDCVVAATHAADADCGRTLTSTSALISRTVSTYPVRAFPSVRWLDMNGDGSFGSADRVYFDMDTSGFPSPADVRMNTGGAATFGSRPVLGDSDTRADLLATVFNAATLIYLDAPTGTSDTLDASEGLAFDLNGNGHFDFGDVSLSNLAGCTAGQRRTGTSTCGISSAGTWKTTATPALRLCRHDEGTAGASRGDGVYVHAGAACTTVAQNDLRITESVVGGVSHAAATRVPASGADNGATLVDATLGTHYTIGIFDTDGTNTATALDALYLELGAGNARAGVGDFRLHNQNSLTFGNILTETSGTDRDTLIVLTALAAPTFTFNDLDGSGGLTPEDPVFLRPVGAACGTVLGTDSRLSAGAQSAAAGTSVAGAIELGRPCTALGAAAFRYLPSSQPFSAASTIIVDLAGDGTVSVGDIRISGGVAGSKIGPTDTLINTPLTAMTFGVALAPRTGLVTMSTVDLNGNAVLESNEPLVLDVDGDGLFGAGDVLVSGTGGSTTLTTTSGGGGGGGGGGGTTNPTTTTSSSSTTSPSATSTTPSSTTPSSTSPSATTTPPATTSAGPATIDILAANQAVDGTLTIVRTGASNVLTWTPIPDAEGYQVWRFEGDRYAYVGLVEGGATGTFTDGGAADASYIVTVYDKDPSGNAVGFSTDMSANPVPGASSLNAKRPTTQETSTSGGGGIPAPAMGVLAATLAAVALLVARRRLR